MILRLDLKVYQGLTQTNLRCSTSCYPARERGAILYDNEPRPFMCRSIKVLRRPAAFATDDEISAAALQFVRKVSGFQKPSRLNQAAFDGAVREIAEATHRLLDSLARGRSGDSTAAGREASL